MTKACDGAPCWSGINHATRVTAATLGVILGIGGMGHGFFEVLQGNTPTGGLVISAIGEADRMWAYGNEPAFTVIPDFLITGIAAMIVGLAIIAWSAGFLYRKSGPLVFLSLFILLFLVGGGIGQVLFFTIGWGLFDPDPQATDLASKGLGPLHAEVPVQAVAPIPGHQFTPDPLCPGGCHLWVRAGGFPPGYDKPGDGVRVRCGVSVPNPRLHFRACPGC